MIDPYRGSPFSRVAKGTAHATGYPTACMVAVLIVLTWAITRPLFAFSDTWNRDSAGVKLKLDELIRAVAGAHNAPLDREDLTEDDLARLRVHCGDLARGAREDLKRGDADTGTSDEAARSAHDPVAA